jgi:quinol monooxygenase YgiN
MYNIRMTGGMHARAGRVAGNLNLFQDRIAMAALVFVRFFPKAGQEALVESILRGMVVSTRQEPGCLRYDLYASVTAPGGIVFCLVEKYADDAAAGAHRETPHYKDYRARIIDLLERPIEVTMLEALDVQAH